MKEEGKMLFNEIANAARNAEIFEVQLRLPSGHAEVEERACGFERVAVGMRKCEYSCCTTRLFGHLEQTGRE